MVFEATYVLQHCHYIYAIYTYSIYSRVDLLVLVVSLINQVGRLQRRRFHHEKLRMKVRDRRPSLWTQTCESSSLWHASFTASFLLPLPCSLIAFFLLAKHHVPLLPAWGSSMHALYSGPVVPSSSPSLSPSTHTNKQWCLIYRSFTGSWDKLWRSVICFAMNPL